MSNLSGKINNDFYVRNSHKLMQYELKKLKKSIRQLVNFKEKSFTIS